MSLELKLKSDGPPPADGRSISPDRLRGLGLDELRRFPIRVGKSDETFDDLFEITRADDDKDHLTLIGDFSGFREVGTRMSSGRLEIRGRAGDGVGIKMTGGEIVVQGDAGSALGAEMMGGTIRVSGSVGDLLGGALPGSRLGMREGVILVEGSAGDDVGLSMRRGLIAIRGDCGAGLGRAMVAGSVFAFGKVGRHAGIHLKRGTIAILAETVPELPVGFVESGTHRHPFLSLYFKSLEKRGFAPPTGVISAGVRRYNGDLSEGGQGEILILA